jgi:hypothetical protein
VHEAGRRLFTSPDSPIESSIDTWTAILKSVASDLTPAGPLSSFTPTIQRLHAMYLVDGEVNNGGFNQLFFNGDDSWLPRAIEGFEQAGLDGHRDIVVAVQVPAATEEAMRAAAHAANTLQAFSDTYRETRLGEYDERWYAMPDIYDTLDQFVVARKADIWDGIER